MDLFELMAQEHQRVAARLARCIETAQSSRLTGADAAAVRALGQYLDAQQRALYPALIAVEPDGAEEPVMRHHRMSVHALAAMSHCRRGHRDAAAAVRMLERAWIGHGQYEQSTLRTLLLGVFSDAERGQLAGAMRAELAASQDGPGSGSGGRHVQPQRAWRWLLRRVAGVQRRMLPRLDDAVFVYRG